MPHRSDVATSGWHGRNICGSHWARFPSPQESEARSMPANQSLRLHDDQRRALLEQRREKRQTRARRHIGPARFNAALRIESKLPAKKQDFRLHRLARPKAQSAPANQFGHGSGDNGQQRQHVAIMPYCFDVATSERRRRNYCGSHPCGRTLEAQETRELTALPTAIASCCESDPTCRTPREPPNLSTALPSRMAHSRRSSG